MASRSLDHLRVDATRYATAVRSMHMDVDPEATNYPLVPSAANPHSRVRRAMLAVLAIAVLSVALPMSFRATAMSTRFDDRVATIARAIANAGAFAGDEGGARFGDPGNLPGQLLCNGVDDANGMSIKRAISLMRSTPEGNALYKQMIANDVCVTVADLGSRAGLAHGVPSSRSGWRWSYISIDQSHLTRSAPDILAATLVHESTHIARAIDGVDCWQSRSCTELVNGVLLEEEIEAHAAEARWWIARYGAGGTPGTEYGDAWQNEIAAKYLDGPSAFHDYILHLRESDSADLRD